MDFHDGICRRSGASSYFEQDKILSHSKLTVKEKMKYEVGRLNTFYNNAPCDARKYGVLAKEGFYCDSNNSIRCAFCETCCPIWNLDTNVFSHNFKCINSQCDGKSNGNVPLISDQGFTDPQLPSKLPQPAGQSTHSMFSPSSEANELFHSRASPTFVRDDELQQSLEVPIILNNASEYSFQSNIESVGKLCSYVVITSMNFALNT